MITALIIIGIILLGITFLCYCKDCYGAAIIFAFMSGYFLSVPFWEKQKELNANKNNMAIKADTIAIIHQDIYIHDADRIKK